MRLAVNRDIGIQEILIKYLLCVGVFLRPNPGHGCCSRAHVHHNVIGRVDVHQLQAVGQSIKRLMCNLPVNNCSREHWKHYFSFDVVKLTFTSDCT